MPGNALGSARRRAAGFALLAGGALQGCVWGYAPAPPPPSAAEVAEAIRAQGEGVFELLDVRAEETRVRRLENGQYRRYWLALVRFEASLRLRADLRVRTADEIVARGAAPDSTVAETAADLQRLALLGPGAHRAGERVTARAVAVFERYDTRWRPAAFDVRARLP